ncbi:Hypothetical protein CINCED_3A011103 [Cinara cedri]|uniref:Endonuclease-reverse transcriptase n=1 Tax=Cinara cedri TaxID=506608 RepID=A0A5E4MIL2_9HEMI|nr:Hypothetical protein CINCED_3A011103 [Cinara cedri]
MEKIYNNKDERKEPIDKIWENIKSAVINASRTTLSVKRKIPSQEWITPNILDLIEERRKYKHQTDIEGQLKYRSIRNRINRESKKAKEEWLEQQCAEINHLFRTSRLDQAYGTIKSFLKTNKTRNNNIKDKNEGAIEGRKPPGRPRNSYISQLKNDVGFDTYAGLKRLAEDRDTWRAKLKTL